MWPLQHLNEARNEIWNYPTRKSKHFLLVRNIYTHTLLRIRANNRKKNEITFLLIWAYKAYNINIALWAYIHSSLVQTIRNITKQYEDDCDADKLNLIKLTTIWNQISFKVYKQCLYYKISCMEKCSRYPFSSEYKLYF